MTADASNMVAVATVDTAREESPTIVRAGGRSLALFYHEGSFYATDNRCPHMGFPLSDGTVDDGILTCPWHHARFELGCGDTLDPFADDVQTYPVEVRDGEILVDPDPTRDVPAEEHWRDRLEHGLAEHLGLVIAKSVIGLDDTAAGYRVPLETGARFGTEYRRAGWGSGLTTLAALANLIPILRPADRRRALYVGLREVANDTAGEPPAFVQEPLSNPNLSADRLTGWFRDNIEVRDADGAERVLRAAIRAELAEEDIARMIAAAATDHRYLDTGHRLDFINKAFETLDHVGWSHADQLLPSLVPGLASANRAEESAAWRQPIDLAELCAEAARDLHEIAAAGADREWTESEDFIDAILGEDPADIVDALTEAIAAGATPRQLARTVAYAAGVRIAQFGTSNEFNDWNTVHHTYSYANAVRALSQRTAAVELYRGVFDAAMKVYLDRFLNTPPAPIPEPDDGADPDDALSRIQETFEVESDDTVDTAGAAVATFLGAGGDPDRLKRALGQALLREDVGFHPRQNVEAAFALHADEPHPDRRRIHLIATARYLAAHTPTRRSGEQTFAIADRLHRGEKIHETA